LAAVGQVRGKILAGSRRELSQREEDLPIAEGADFEAVFVVLGEAGGLKNTVVTEFGETLDGFAGERRTDAGGGKKTATSPADPEVSLLKLAEFIDVDAVDDFGQGRRQGNDRDLDHVVAIEMGVDGGKRFAVDDVFGVVGDDGGEAFRGGVLMNEHGLVNPVQTVCFGGRAVVGDEAEVDVFEAGLHVADRVEGGGVVGVGADEDVVLLITNGGDVLGDHGADDGVFLPEGDEDGEGAFVWRGCWGWGRCAPLKVSIWGWGRSASLRSRLCRVVGVNGVVGGGEVGATFIVLCGPRSRLCMVLRAGRGIPGGGAVVVGVWAAEF